MVLDGANRFALKKWISSASTMRIKTIPAEGESLLVSCLVDREGGITLTDSEGVALTAPAYDTADKVSLND